MNTIQQFENILLKLQAVGIKGLIAGGACRDHMLGKPVKDIDVFVEFDEEIEKKLQAAFGVLHVHPIIAAEYAGAGGELAHVYDISESHDPFSLKDWLGHTPVQVIVLAKGYDVLERTKHNDFGICQVWYVEGMHRFGHTEAFHWDMTHKTFTLSHCEGQQQFDRSMRRWFGKFKERFQGFVLVVPQEFLQYAQPHFAASA